MDTLQTAIETASSYWQTYKWGYHGMWGIVLYILLAQMKGKQTVESIKGYFVKHWVNLASSLIAYWMLMILWQYVGIDWIVTKVASIFFDDFPTGFFPKGQLSPMSFLVALCSHPIVNTITMKLRKPHEKEKT